ncbi:Neutral and basic amino acid transport protein rBAT, partial [Stegodyphus mimosarum]
MNPSVTSDQHTWAAHWLLHRPGRYEHYYVNVTEDEEEPPLESNPDYSDQSWTPPHRTFGNHLYLNWSNTHLQREMREVMEFWLSQGVDGFYMKHLENLHVVDEAHVASAIHQWRYVLDKYSVNSTRKILMVSHATMEHLKAVMDSLSYMTLPSFIDLVDASINLVVNGSVQDI